MYSYELRIPKDRVAVLIGKKGSTKKLIEQKTKTKLKISASGDIVLKGEDNLALFVTQNIIKAIGRGFNPDIALTLLDENNLFEIIQIKEFTGKSQKKFTRVKARLIGTKGKAKKIMGQITNTEISIYGKTVSIIGPVENVGLAKRAIEKLLQGAPHGHVYKFIEAQKKDMKKLI